MKGKVTKKEVKNEVKNENNTREYYFIHHVSYKGTQYEPNKLYDLEMDTVIELQQYLLCKDKYPVVDGGCGCRK